MEAVLFDLDGTLLQNDFDALMHEYFRRLAHYFSPWIKADDFVKVLMDATNYMIDDVSSDLTNMDKFSAYFFSRSGLDPTLVKVFDDFYQNEFPKLRFLAKAHPDARATVQAAFDLGYKVVVATNPVFPGDAIKERLRWAGVDHFSFDLITTVDNMHYCKPHIQYYQEICRLIDVAPEKCLMVGDDPKNDGPAGEIGMELFLLTNGQKLKDSLQLMRAKRGQCK